MKILVTGAAGFLGRRLLADLLAGRTAVPAVSRVIAADLTPCPIDDPRVESRVGDITDGGFISAIVDRDVRVIWHLAAVLSGQSEAEFDVGLRVNVDATRALLDRARGLATPPRFVFSSTIAALGAPLPDVVPEDQVLRPQSSYGAAKVIAETLVSEYSRRGFVDGIACRVPTVAIRPGKPNSALSSFVSAIIREPLAGIDAVCPVPLDTRGWITSPRVATENLAHAATVPGSALTDRRVVNLPGLSVTPAEMLDSLERLGGAAARRRVRVEVDPHIARIVRTWPGAFDVSRALSLGFVPEGDIDSIVAQFIDER
jgi:nucleoside-diphosphate-sugar epimerase